MRWLFLFLLAASAFAGPTLHDLDQEEGVESEAHSGRVVQKFASAAGAEEFARAHGLVHLGAAHPGSPFHVFAADPAAAGRAAGEPLPTEKVVQRHPRVPGGRRGTHARDVGVFGMRNQPGGLDRQWHLQPDSVYGAERVHYNARAAWARGWRGQGAKVLIVDDGVQRDHEDLAGAVLPACSRSVVPGDARPLDPSPAEVGGRIAEYHGTACAGIIAARNDTGQRCGMGVAPEAGLCAVKLYGETGYVTDSIEAGALFCGDCTAVSISYGPNDYTSTFGGPGPAAQHAIYQMAREARGGRGIPIVWAGGNGGDPQHLDTSNADGYANSVYVLAVGAVADDRTTAYYSEPGENLLLAGPSSGGWNGIYTTYATGAKVDCFGQMGGTSAVAPGIAGLAALVLAAVPTLTSRQLEHVLVLSTQQRLRDEALYAKDHANGGFFLGPRAETFPWVVNAAGLAHSGLLGFGVPDAVRAVEMAQRTDMYWYHLPDAAAATKVFAVGTGIVNAGSSQIYAESLPGSEHLRRVERVQLVVSLDAPSQLKRLTIEVESPAGTTSLVWPETRHGQTAMRWVLSSVKFWNEPVEGMWKVRFFNHGSQRAIVHSAILTVHGYGDVVTGRTDGLVHDRVFDAGHSVTDMRELV